MKSIHAAWQAHQRNLLCGVSVFVRCMNFCGILPGSCPSGVLRMPALQFIGIFTPILRWRHTDDSAESGRKLFDIGVP